MENKYPSKNCTASVDWHDSYSVMKALVEFSEGSLEASLVLTDLTNAALVAAKMMPVPIADKAEAIAFFHTLDMCGIYGQRLVRMYERFDNSAPLTLMVLGAIKDEVATPVDFNAYIDGIPDTDTEELVNGINELCSKMVEMAGADMPPICLN